MVGMRSVAPADTERVRPDYSAFPQDRSDLFGGGEEKLAGWDPALTPADDEGAEQVRLRFRDDLEWSGDGAQGDHIVWRYQ